MVIWTPPPKILPHLATNLGRHAPAAHRPNVNESKVKRRDLLEGTGCTRANHSQADYALRDGVADVVRPLGAIAHLRLGLCRGRRHVPLWVLAARLLTRSDPLGSAFRHNHDIDVRAFGGRDFGRPLRGALAGVGGEAGHRGAGVHEAH
eukprot:5263970-Prymnesium_polylepis.2